MALSIIQITIGIGNSIADMNPVRFGRPFLWAMHQDETEMLWIQKRGGSLVL